MTKTKALSTAAREALHAQLLDRRRELIDRRRALEESWRAMQAPESEFEETASKGTLAWEMQHRGENLQAEIGRVDDALGRMGEGGYGLCEGCGEPIRVERLRAIPWTRHCVDCAGRREAAATAAPPPATAAPGGGENTDEEMAAAIEDALVVGGRVDTGELEVACEDGLVYLAGRLPDEAARQILLEIVSDLLGFREVEDRVRIDRPAWERRERQPGTAAPREPSAETQAGDEEGAGADPYTSLRTGEPMAPPDRLVPENPEE